MYNFEKMKEQKDTEIKNKPYRFFGIKWKMTIALGLIVIVISVISFQLATYIHLTLTMSNAIDIDIYSLDRITEKLDLKSVNSLLKEGSKIYYSIPEEKRRDPKSEEYRSLFKSLENEEYLKLRQELLSMAEFENLKWLDLRFEDEENGRWVFLLDTDPKADGRYETGYWEDEPSGVSVFMGASNQDDNDDQPEKNLFEVFMDLRYFDLSSIERFSVVKEIFDPETGKLLGYIGAGELYTDYHKSISLFISLYLMVLVFFLIVIYIVSNILVGHWLVNPLVDLTSAAADFIGEKNKSENKGYFKRVKITTHDELLLLKDSMTDMESDLSRYVNDISRMTAEKEREAVEMEMSSKIQSSLLPQELEDYSGEHSFEISSLITPAKDVAGDFYDYYVIDDDHIGITIADVSDKGVPAALFMMVTKTLLHIAGKTQRSPAEILSSVNRQLYDQNKEAMFVTVFFGIYTVSEKKIVYVNAGHEDPVLFQESTGLFELNKEQHDLVLAIMPEVSYTEHTLFLKPGDKLYLYTDGVTDALNPENEMFGEKKMVDSLNALKDLSGNELLYGMRKCLNDFSKEAPRFDDITMLLLEIL